MKKILVLIIIILSINTAFAIEEADNLFPSGFNEDISFFAGSENKNTDYFLIDSYLKVYLNKAKENNFSIKIAKDRIAQYEELAKQVNSIRLPWLAVSPSGGNQRTLSTNSNTYKDTNLYTLPVQMNWELDVFGKNKLKYQSSKLDTKIKEEELKQAELLVYTDIKIAYYNLLLNDFLIKNSLKITDNLAETIKLKKQLYENGIISYDDIYLTELEYTKEVEQLNNSKIQSGIFMHQIAALTGSMKKENYPYERSDINSINIPEKIGISINDIMLKNRPDIKISEIETQKAHIDVKEAQKEFYPSVYLNELIGLTTINITDLFNWYSRIYNLAAQIVMDIYTGGYKKANLRYRQNILKEKADNYKNTVLMSIKETEDILCSFNNDYKTYKFYEKNLANARHYENVINIRNKNGISSKIDFLDSQRQVYINENLYFTYKTKVISDLINLNKSFGGVEQ